MLNPWQDDARRMQRHFFSGAVPAQPDKLGRVVIPQFLRTYAQLETEVVVVGLADRIEVWSRSEWQRERIRSASATAPSWPSTCAAPSWLDDADRVDAARWTHQRTPASCSSRCSRRCGRGQALAFGRSTAPSARGGHSFALLERSAPDGQLVGLDADPAALELRQHAAWRRSPAASSCSTATSASWPTRAGPRAVGRDRVRPRPVVDAARLQRTRLFVSPRRAARHALRRRTRTLPTAAELLNTLSEAELERMLREFGEEPRARRLARTIVQRREQRPFSRTGDLVAAVTVALGPARGRIHPATRTFQALRIAVNDELAALEPGLDAALGLLEPGGRLAVISFQSLEDRIVKWRFRGWADAGPGAGR